MTFSNLCNSCTNIGCEFQSGIVRTKCAFYMPPQLEPDNCGNYVVQDLTTKNDLGADREDAVERLNALKQFIGYDKDSEIVKATQKSLDMAIKTLEQEPRWIPVNEKRPVGLEKVLVTYRLHYDNSIHVGIGNITINDVNGRYHWNINEQDYNGWDMLAWMPLPQPYKAESEKA